MQQYTPTRNMRIRRLTPIECERLQGFPDNWTKYGHDGKEISDSQRYKMMGNSVSVPVVKAVMERLFAEVKL
jgi:DNA (cytosine-5)-methyltransferase 1